MKRRICLNRQGLRRSRVVNLAGVDMRHMVNILGEECTVTVSQSSKTVWIASGYIEGQHISTKSRSANSAFDNWISAARYRRARN
jgi:hypothetical protein